jgi:hypothetical protein
MDVRAACTCDGHVDEVGRVARVDEAQGVL